MSRSGRSSSSFWAGMTIATLYMMASSSSAWGQITTNWTNAAGGTFNVAGNWSAGVPGTLDTAFFNNVSPSYTVTFTNSPTNADFGLGTNLALSFTNSGGPRTYTITSSGQNLSSAGSSFTVTGSGMGMTWSNASGSWALSNGFDFSVEAGAVVNVAKPVIVGFTGSGSTTSTLNVTGAGSTFVSTGAATNHIGSTLTPNTSGTLNVTNGASASFSGSSFQVIGSGAVTGRTGTVTVSSGSSLSIPSLSLGTITISGNTANFTVDGSSSTATVTGASTMTVGSTSASGTVATLNVNNNGIFNTGTGAVTVNASGTVGVAGGTFNQNGDMTIQGGGDFNLTSGTHNVAATRTITVTGSGSSYTKAGSSFTLNGGSSMTVQSGASAAINTLFNLGTGGTAGTFTVTGAGSTVVNAGAAQVTVGANGTLNVNSSGVFDSGIGGFTIFSGGQVNVGGGTLTLDAAANVIGTLSVTSGFLNLNANNVVQSSGLISITGGTVNQNASLLVHGNVSAAGSAFWNQNGSVTVENGGTMTLNNPTIIAPGQSLTVQNPGSLYAVTGLTLSSGSTTSLSEGTIQVGGFGITASVGAFTWTSGTVRYTSNATLNGSVITTLLGSPANLTVAKHLEVQGTAALSAPLTLAGGTFSAGSLTGGNLLTLSSGTLNITNSGITVGSGGTLGSVVNVASGVTINQTASTANTISSDGRLVLSGGTFNTTGNLTNNGEVQLSSSLTTLGGSGTFINNSTVLGTGRIEKNLTNNAAGSIQVTGNDRLVFNGTTNSNAGRIDATNGGQIEFRNALTNAASTGLITGRDATLRFNAGLTNNGSMAFSNGTMDVFGDIQQNVGGRITISGGGVLNFYDDVTIAPGANSVQASASGGIVSSAVFFGSYNGGITGGGTAFIEGDHRPGNSPGLVSFGGDVFYGGLSTLHAELGGLSRGSQYDAIDVNGVVSLAGNLEIDLINGFVPTPGNTFLLIDNAGTDAVVGTFVGLAEGATFQADGAFFQISYTGGTGNDVVLTSAVPEPGTIALFGLIAGGGVGWWRWRRQQKLLAQEQVSAID